MIQLLDLAPEILLHVVRCLSGAVDILGSDVDLYRLALTCRTMFNITEPFLYTKFVQSDKTQVYQFLRTILQKPTYASKVKLLALDHRGEEAEDDDDDDEDYEEERDGDRLCIDTHASDNVEKEKELALLIEAFDKSGIPRTGRRLSRDDWIAGLQKQKQPAVFSMLLLSLPNLESFHMQTDSNNAAPFLAQAVDSAASQNPPRYLTNLQELHLGLAYPQPSDNLDYYRPFFYLSSLRKMELRALSAWEFDWEPSIADCNIESLELPRGEIEGQAWATLFAPMKKLKSLSYSPGNSKYLGFMDLSPRSEQLLLNHVPRADALKSFTKNLITNSPFHIVRGNLTLVKDTLESLDLSEFYLQSDNEGLIGSLRDFPKLKTLRIQADLLMGETGLDAKEGFVERLPEALEELTLWEDCYSHERRSALFSDVVCNVVMKKESHFPGLRKISTDQKRLLDLKRLQEVCQAQGVQFEMHDHAQ